MAKNDFDTSHLFGKSLAAAKLILDEAQYENAEYKISGGGCKAFYTPKEWQDRGEDYGRDSVLIVVHDGGDLAPFFNMDYGSWEMQDRMREKLASIGLFAEMCTGWYSAIYKL